jgi:hypothetical protein
VGLAAARKHAKQKITRVAVTDPVAKIKPESKQPPPANLINAYNSTPASFESYFYGRAVMSEIEFLAHFIHFLRRP